MSSGSACCSPSSATSPASSTPSTPSPSNSSLVTTSSTKSSRDGLQTASSIFSIAVCLLEFGNDICIQNSVLSAPILVI
ncbi:hydrophobic protein LTI6B [Oryza sativa Japonica Group]|uniref:Os05g0138300 protein n=2 Tax=Oryza sativa subsp. japonica TaxID=39947 RepID=Q6AT94_ORYSJ|nr:hydrophobic protein LTI6B [Oryza sativa Japonica Group]AAT77364.1 unknown protein [Oryza sativa Japonica Group]KAB8098027.1 hypothetical protein EE612_026970 [Oryza sativa]BAS92174.1 Os05g0138300 [Oryza sativa Japonica Group]